MKLEELTIKEVLVEFLLEKEDYSLGELEGGVVDVTDGSFAVKRMVKTLRSVGLTDLNDIQYIIQESKSEYDIRKIQKEEN